MWHDRRKSVVCNPERHLVRRTDPAAIGGKADIVSTPLIGRF
jgi:hypothetical protein